VAGALCLHRRGARGIHSTTDDGHERRERLRPRRRRPAELQLELVRGLRLACEAEHAQRPAEHVGGSLRLTAERILERGGVEHGERPLDHTHFLEQSLAVLVPHGSQRVRLGIG
jgi:hypothetical protein